MAKNRKCILCETVYVSRQEMEEHMRSMLHHRELENLKGRDCGHECRVCKITVVSLTDYASHISSPTHKQNVEDFERIPARNTSNEEYFDKTLVELIEKRNEQIRKEKESAAAKLAQEEAERKRKEEFQQRLKETKERFRLELQQQSNLYGPQQGSWYKGNQYGTNPGHMQNVRPWQQSKWGKSSTWHAQEPPTFKKFNKIPPPWISNAGSSNGVYGCNNISQNVRPRMGPPPPLFPSLPKFFTKGVNQFHSQATNQGATQKSEPKAAEKQNTEAENPNNKGNKSFGSNPKFDKTCRWSPYHVNNKGSESMPNLVQKTPKSQKVDKGTESVISNPDKRNSSGESSNNSSRSSSLQRDGQNATTTTTTLSPSTQRAKIAVQKAERRPSVGAGPCGGAQVSKTSTQNNEKLKTKNSLSGLSKSDRQLTETVKNVKQLEKRWSLDSLSNIGQKTTQVQGQEQVGVNKENTMRQNQAKMSMPALSKPAKLPDQSLQHLQVSTSSLESSAGPSVNEEGDKTKVNTETEPSEDTLIQSTVDTDVLKPSDSQIPFPKSKINLSPLLKKDLTKHMIPNKAKSTTNLEPNLNIARRVRNLTESKKSDCDKDSGLKPTIRQLISPSGSRRKVNWEQVYHEVRKKQDKGKGMPRFGIEMVPIDQEDHSQEEEDFTLLEGFHWDSLLGAQTPPTSRKRSLSESSIAPTPNAPFLDNLVIKSEPQEPSQDTDLLQEIEMGLCDAEHTAQRRLDLLQRSHSVAEESSGTEMCEGQGTSKKRRARDVPHPETSSLEHHTKRRKKSKKVAERSHIMELLAVSLREDELSRSLLSLDTDLIKARAALEAAYVEVQRLMIAKQQVNTEMGTLRNKRIELLKGMQGCTEEAPDFIVKEKRQDDSDVHLSSSVSSITDPSLCGTNPRASPPAPCVPFTPMAVKEEPRSPVHINSEQDSAVYAHSTTPELPSAASATEAALYSLPSPERRSELCQRRPDQERDEFGDSVDSKESLADLVQSIEKGIQASQGHTEPNTNDKMPAPSWRDSEVGSFVESTAAPSFETPSGFNVPASPSEMRSVKKVRKLKKRKSLKKAQSSELPESSDTEMDTEASRPRCPRSRRRNSGGSQVSTSNQQTEEREEDVKMEEEEELHIEKKDPKPSKSSAKQLRVMLTAVTVKAEPEKNAPGFSGPTLNPDSAKPEAQNVACYEVSSTSDMDVSPAPESDVQVSFALPKMGKTSSDVSSDHGEDDVPTEGSFEGHLEAVNSMQIHDGLLYTCSGDRTVRAFDIVSHKCVAVFEGHSSKVNALLVSAGPYLHRRLYTGSSDLTIRCYSLTTQKFEEQFSLADRVLCLHSRWKIMFAGLGNGTVVNFNLKTNKQMDVFECHGPRAVSCLASSQEGARRLLLVGSYDNTISVRDAKNGLLLRTLEGHSKTVLCMKVVNDLVFSGSSDQCVYAHNIHSGQLVRTYKGHSHAVSVVCVQGKVMLTACLDKLIRVYDLQSHEQLQVYGGHKDMVMCMTTHKNMIYTGCYDGSVQAIKLNLMQNYHCRWHGCSMVFGVLDHLEHHLCNNHTSQNLQMLRCRWKNCEEFFSGRISSKKAMLLHMQKHAAEESQVEP